MEGVLTEAERDYYFLNRQPAIRQVQMRCQPVWLCRTTIKQAAEGVLTRSTPGGAMPPGEKQAQ